MYVHQKQILICDNRLNHSLVVVLFKVRVGYSVWCFVSSVLIVHTCTHTNTSSWPTLWATLPSTTCTSSVTKPRMQWLSSSLWGMWRSCFPLPTLNMATGWIPTSPSYRGAFSNSHSSSSYSLMVCSTCLSTLQLLLWWLCSQLLNIKTRYVTFFFFPAGEKYVMTLFAVLNFAEQG